MLSNLIKRKRNSLIKNINLNLSNKKQKKVLISYISSPLKMDLNKESIYHTNILEVLTIIKVFIDLGFCIDLIDNDDIDQINNLDVNEYHIIFGFGKCYEKLSSLSKRVINISYITENEPKISKNKEEERINYYYYRHRKKVKLERSFKYYTPESFKNSKYGIIMSDLENFKEYNFEKYFIYPTGFKNKTYNLYNNINSRSTKNFIWIGSRGAVHKGLDIVIDIFRKNRNLNLYLCGLTQSDKKMLKIKDEENIFDLGKVNIQSDRFVEVIDKCVFQIQASCSEACSTSVLTGLRHGLIPIIIKDTGMNRLLDYSLVSSDYKIDKLEKIVLEASNKSKEEILKKQEENYIIANELFNLENFKNTFKEIIKNILEREQ